MAKEVIDFEQFLNTVDPNFEEFTSNLHDYLIDNGCKPKFEQKSSGLFISYKHNKSKKSVANLLFRKKGLMIRIFGEHANKYSDFMNTLPEEMIKSIKKASVCKRLIDPDVCNSRCTMGYDFTIGNERFIKCKNNCFMFLINNENNPYIQSFIENEVTARAV